MTNGGVGNRGGPPPPSTPQGGTPSCSCCKFGVSNSAPTECWLIGKDKGGVPRTCLGKTVIDWKGTPIDCDTPNCAIDKSCRPKISGFIINAIIYETFDTLEVPIFDPIPPEPPDPIPVPVPDPIPEPPHDPPKISA